MKIIVRKEHVVEAKRKDSHHCMVADAIKDKLGVQFISVDTQKIEYSDPKTKKRYTFLTPKLAQNEILRWDRGIEVQPFSFELSDPIKIKPVRSDYKGKHSSRQKAQRKYSAKLKAARNSMSPRLVKKNKKGKVSRFREFGLRKWTNE